METIAAITTAKAIAAISSIEIVGADALHIVEKIFVPFGPKKLDLLPGSTFTGKIVSDGESLDHVVLGCLDVNDFEVNCHGNPLIVEKIAKLVVSLGARLVSSEQLLGAKLQNNPSLNAIQIESKIAAVKSTSLKAAELISNQPEEGLGRVCDDWLNNIDSVELSKVKSTATRILQRSQNAKYLINPVKAVLAGPPNSGKSTLLNALAGKQKAIVTDVAGTTRDWVSTALKTDSLLVEFFDTAGIDAALANCSNTDAASQDTSARLVSEADLILFVVDGSSEDNVEPVNLPEDKKTILVYNKSDLGQANNIGVEADATVSISAKEYSNVGQLLSVIDKLLGAADVNTTDAVCFTERQCNLLEKIVDSPDHESAKTAISQLLIGPLYV